MNPWLERLLEWFASRDTRQPASCATSSEARLTSSLPEAHFRATIEAVWPALQPELSPRLRSAAEHHLRHIAQGICCRHSLLQLGEAQTAVNLALNQDLQITNDVRLLAAEAALTTEPAGLELAERHDALQQEVGLARITQEAKLMQLRLLGDHVLADPALARLWWLDGRPEKLPEMVDMGRVFEEAAALVLTQPSGSAPQDPVPELIWSFLRDLTPEHRELLIRRLPAVFGAYEREDLAEQLVAWLRAQSPPWADNGASCTVETSHG